ncbi:hypothetical protein [Clavibacter californiensis]|uniref:Type II methyltransferase M.Eco57I C-terminal domain-containing protein n=1 Tax=Clavibacter californiensis TaxID=1401995 RepID=A0ABX9N9N7_9MICO|nr:hypothetical protein [Clavibacter californiensis]RII94874.1 hypothetical protein DZF98_00175 [Clavibacter californiensis]UKF81702.1 hypothetical protein FGD68_15175 [Clavibacter californiensis]
MKAPDSISPDATPPSRNIAGAVAVVMSWIDEQSSAPVPPTWVPGASARERQALASLGGAVHSYWASTGRTPEWISAWDDIQEWLTDGPKAPASVTSAIALLAASGPDAIARLYDSAVHAAARRHLGTFFTPSAEARWMVKRWTSTFGSPDAVVDVGAGVGVFTVAAHEAWPSAELIPIDINPITLGLVALLASPSLNERVRPVQADFAAWSHESFGDVEGRRLILGNPPYTRLQLIPPAQRALLLAAAGGLCTARASLSALMLGTSLTMIGEHDGVCLLLPAQWLESDYAEGLREWLWARTDRRVELHLFESQLFADAQIDAVSLLVGPAQPTRQPLVLGMATSTKRAVASRVREVDRADQAEPPANWRHLFARDTSEPARAGQPLSVLATIRRGTATGANAFFTLSPEEVERWDLPASSLRHFIQRTRDHTLSVTTQDLEALGPRSKRFMLVIDRSAMLDAHLRHYLRHGIRNGVHARVLTRTRGVWFALGSEASAPDVIVSASARQGFTLLENQAGAVIANNLYGLRWHATTPLEVRDAVLRWLRSPDGQVALLAVARHQADGLRKLEVSALARLTIPDSVTT